MSTVSQKPDRRRDNRVRRQAGPRTQDRGSPPQHTPEMLYLRPLWSAEQVLQFHSFDASYVQSLCAGDQQTQQHFVGYFTLLLRLKLRSRLQSPHAIEDVCQETFFRVLAVLRKEGGLRQPERLGAFVNTVCRNVLLEHYRSSKGNESLDVEGRPELPSTEDDAFDIASASQIKEKVTEILLGLPLRDRQLLRAVFLDERDRDEVCSEFGIDRDYLRVMLHRAKQEFKTQYVKRIGDPARLGTYSRNESTDRP